MHVLLRMSRLNELLPPSVQEVAAAAANGSFADLKSMRQMICIDESQDSGVALPIIYRCLDPKNIPTVNEGAPCTAVAVASLALQIMEKVKVPPGAGAFLWPRAWAWFLFLNEFRAKKTGVRRTILQCASRLRQDERKTLLNATPGFHTLVARVWADLVDGPNAAFAKVRFVVVFLMEADISNLGHLAEGLGGSFDELALLLVRTVNLAPGDDDENINFTPLDLLILHCVFKFATNVAMAADEDDNTANAPRRIISALVVGSSFKFLTTTVVHLSLTTDPDPAPTINTCFGFLQALLSRRNMHRILPAAVKSGLLGCIILCGTRPTLTATHNYLRSFLLRHLSAYTVYAEVLGTIKDALLDVTPILEAATPEFKTSAIFGDWKYFVDTVEERQEVFDEILTRRKLCDNLACNKPGMKTDHQLCSGCKHFYYCSPECQHADWRNGNHKSTCSAYSTLSLSKKHAHITQLDRDFLRALLDFAYIKYKGQIFDDIIRHMRSHPDAGYFIVFDYLSDGPFSVTLHSLTDESPALETLRKSGAEWDAIVARAARSQGRISIHVMRVREGNEGRYWVIPLHAPTGEMHEDLRRIADEPSPPHANHFAALNRLDYAFWDLEATH